MSPTNSSHIPRKAPRPGVELRNVFTMVSLSRVTTADGINPLEETNSFGYARFGMPFEHDKVYDFALTSPSPKFIWRNEFIFL